MKTCTADIAALNLKAAVLAANANGLNFDYLLPLIELSQTYGNGWVNIPDTVADKLQPYFQAP